MLEKIVLIVATGLTAGLALMVSLELIITIQLLWRIANP